MERQEGGHSQFAGLGGLDGNEILIGYTYYGDADPSGGSTWTTSSNF
jgi:hypothetical protein